MSLTIDATAFDRATDPVLQILSPEQAAQIVDFHSDETLQQRIETLAEKANEGELTADEQAEYMGTLTQINSSQSFKRVRVGFWSGRWTSRLVK